MVERGGCGLGNVEAVFIQGIERAQEVQERM